MNTIISRPFRYRLRSLIYHTPLRTLFAKLRQALRQPPAHEDSGWWDNALKSEKSSYLGEAASIGLREAIIGELLCQFQITPRAILDMGCGGGTLCRSLAQFKPETYTGVDISRYAIERNISTDANGKNGHGMAISFVESSLQTYAPPNGVVFDVIAFNEVLYYLDVHEACQQVKRYCQHLDHNGVIAVTMKDDPKSHAIFRKLTREFDWVGGTLFQECGSQPHFRIKMNEKSPAYVIGLLRPKSLLQS